MRCLWSFSCGVRFEFTSLEDFWQSLSLLNGLRGIKFDCWLTVSKHKLRGTISDGVVHLP